MRLRHGDKRWTRLILKRRFSPGWPAYSDLRSVARQKNLRTRLFLYYSTDNRAAPAHVNHLADLPGIQLRAQAEGGHRVVTHLKNSGELERILRTAVDGRAVPWPDGCEVSRIRGRFRQTSLAAGRAFR